MGFGGGCPHHGRRVTKLARFFIQFGVCFCPIWCIFIFSVQVFCKSAEAVSRPFSDSNGRGMGMLAIHARAEEEVVGWKGNSSGDG